VRYLILSDLHANRQALEAVLADARDKRYDACACCGDIVGYGADPVWALDWVRENVPAVVRGNHDKACAGLEDLEWFNPAARKSALWTASQLNAERIEWLRHLPQGPVQLDGFDLIHGSPVDEDEYVIGVRDAAGVSPYLEAPTTFFGHTHLQGGFLLHRNGVRSLRRPLPPESDMTIELEPDSFYLVNPGSVGQPRDSDPRAAYCVFDTDQRTVTYYRVSYDVAGAQQRIRSAGLPAVHADRLAIGS
jgi:predicted phosphodiesterase